jgi:hypothetical protein
MVHTTQALELLSSGVMWLQLKLMTLKPVANYYEVLGIYEYEVKVLQMLNDSVSEYINVGAGVGGGFTNTNELGVMKYHEAINGPDGKK